MTSRITEAAQLSTRILRSLDEIQQISFEWRGLFSRAKTTPFQSPEWLLPWIDVFRPDRMLCIEIRDGSRRVGLAPLLIYRRDSENVVAFMGGGVSDYLDLVIAPGYEDAVLSAILQAVADVESWDVLELTDIHSSSALLRSCLGKYAREHDACSVLNLPSSTDDLLHLFSKRQRANLRNARSRLQRAGGGDIERASQENIRQFVDDLFVLHTNRWSERGQSGVLNDDHVRRFHLAAAPLLINSGLLHVSRLRVGGRTAAVIYSFFHSQTAFCYLQGFDPEFAPLSPGTQLMFSVIAEAMNSGMRQFDFLRGQEAYKQHWRAERRPTYRIHLTRDEVSALLESGTLLTRTAA